MALPWRRIAGFAVSRVYDPRDVSWAEFEATLGPLSFVDTSIHTMQRGRQQHPPDPDVMRARFRNGAREPLKYEFSSFTFVSREVRNGSRLQLRIAAPDSIYVQ